MKIIDQLAIQAMYDAQARGIATPKPKDTASIVSEIITEAVVAPQKRTRRKLG